MSRDVRKQHASNSNSDPNLSDDQFHALIQSYGVPIEKWKATRKNIMQSAVRGVVDILKIHYSSPREANQWFAWKVNDHAWRQLFPGNIPPYPRAEPLKPLGHDKLLAVFDKLAPLPQPALAPQGTPSLQQRLDPRGQRPQLHSESPAAGASDSIPTNPSKSLQRSQQQDRTRPGSSSSTSSKPTVAMPAIGASFGGKTGELHLADAAARIIQPLPDTSSIEAPGSGLESVGAESAKTSKVVPHISTSQSEANDPFGKELPRLGRGADEPLILGPWSTRESESRSSGHTSFTSYYGLHMDNEVKSLRIFDKSTSRFLPLIDALVLCRRRIIAETSNDSGNPRRIFDEELLVEAQSRKRKREESEKGIFGNREAGQERSRRTRLD